MHCAAELLGCPRIEDERAVVRQRWMRGLAHCPSLVDCLELLAGQGSWSVSADEVRSCWNRNDEPGSRVGRDRHDLGRRCWVRARYGNPACVEDSQQRASPFPCVTMKHRQAIARSELVLANERGPESRPAGNV